MILDEKVIIKIKGNNKLPFYRSLGYDTNVDELFINVKDLLPTSTALVNVSCDFCNLKFKVKYKNYYRNINRHRINKYACSRTCANEKIRLTSMDKYGVSHYSKSNIISDKRKKTCIEKYGSEYYYQSDNFKNKSKETCLSKYGVDNPFKSDDIKDIIKQTNISKYGVDNPAQSYLIKDKIIKTNLEKYGVKYYVEFNGFKDNLDLHLEKSKKTHLEKYGVDNNSKSEEYRKSTIIGSDVNYIRYLNNSISLFKCENGHNFEISSDNYRGRSINNIPLCTICNPIGDSKSIKENNLFEFISDNYNGEIISSYRDGLEIDIYLPALKLGFEFNGLYWHSEKYKEKNYHINKTNYFKDKEIRIIHIWEDDWSFRGNIIKSQILNLLGKSNKIYARKCIVKVIDVSLVRKFLDENHIQGFVSSVIKIGLYYENDLVSIMLFDHNEGRKKMLNNEWNLSRFCNKVGYNVIGGASKLLNYFTNEYKPSRIISYADKDWSVGNLYYTLGFNLLSDSIPDYKYIVNRERVHKSRYKKDKLGIIGTDITESQKMKSENICRIYDCGKIKFEKKYVI